VNSAKKPLLFVKYYFFPAEQTLMQMQANGLRRGDCQNIFVNIFSKSVNPGTVIEEINGRVIEDSPYR